VYERISNENILCTRDRYDADARNNKAGISRLYMPFGLRLRCFGADYVSSVLFALGAESGVSYECMASSITAGTFTSCG
jgi:hypothetical protein